MKFSFIKSKLKMIDELYDLWDNQELYRFIKGREYIRERELEITECIPSADFEKDFFIEYARSQWMEKQKKG